LGNADDLVRLSRTRGELQWMRAHFDGRLRAEIRGADRGACVVLVRRGDEPIRETRLAMDAEAARPAADAITLELYPHECTGAQCGAWVAMSRGKKPA
jgi:hypothetical protein